MTQTTQRFRLRHPWLPAVAALIAATCFGANVGDVLYVVRPTVPVRNAPFAFDPIIGWAKERDSMTVIGARGKWLKVRCAVQATADTQPVAVEGYVLADALVTQPTPMPVGKDGKALPPPDPVGALSAKVYCDAKGLGPEPFTRLMADSRDAMQNGESKFEQFTRAGKVGPHKPGASAAGR